MLSRVIEMWREAFNVSWQYSRQGTLSANDSRFVALDLGFRGSSVSLPGRVFRTNTPSGSVRSTRIGATPTSAFSKGRSNSPICQSWSTRPN